MKKTLFVILGLSMSLAFTTVSAKTINHISLALWSPLGTSDAAVNVTDFLNEKCLGKETCDVQATNEFFLPVTQRDISPGHAKVLSFIYTCSNQDFPWVIIRAEGSSYKLDCSATPKH